MRQTQRFPLIRVRARPGRRSRGRADRRAARAIPVALGRSRHPGQQARRRRRHPARPVSAAAAVVAGRPRAAAARPCCRSGASAATSPGARIPPTAATTGRSAGRPMNQATGCGATTGSTTSSSRSTTTPGRGSPAAAARCSSMWRGRIARRPPAASRWTAERSAPSAGRSSDRRRESTIQIFEAMTLVSVRAPKIAVPTRTWVAPNAIAVGKSALIPMDKQLQPVARARSWR